MGNSCFYNEGETEEIDTITLSNIFHGLSKAGEGDNLSVGDRSSAVANFIAECCREFGDEIKDILIAAGCDSRIERVGDVRERVEEILLSQAGNSTTNNIIPVSGERFVQKVV